VWTGSRWEARVESTPPYLDVQALVNSYPVDGNRSRLFGFNFASGMWSSLMEDHVFTQFHNLPSVSTIKALNEATWKGQAIYQINATNVNTALARTSLPQAVEDSIRDAVSSGKWVIAHEAQVRILNWTGAGWIEYDPVTGVAGWLIYGGMITGSEALTRVDAEPVILQGGSGTDWRPWGPCTPRAPHDGGFAGTDFYEWWSRTAGSYIDTVGDFPMWEETRHLTVIERTTYYSHAQYGGTSVIVMSQETRVLTRVTRTIIDDVGPAARTVAKYGGWVITGATTFGEVYEIYNNPYDTRPLSQKHWDAGARSAYNVASTLAAGQAAALGAKAGGALCLLAGPLGGVACALIGGIGAGVGASYLSDRLKQQVFPECS
jgi:hypothetical protein